MSVPAFWVVVPLEGAPRLHIVADSAEDERALYVWLASSAALPQVADRVLGLWHALDQLGTASS